jgi:uncharacterized protein YodC (DUF2158 family)
MADVEIKPGDVVQLKSGSPLMTVSYIEAADEYGPAQARCAWFDAKKECSGTFPVHSLVKSGGGSLA